MSHLLPKRIALLSACALFADFDNRGLQDLLVVCGSGPLLYRNQGDGTFALKRGAFQFATPPQGTFTHAAIADRRIPCRHHPMLPAIAEGIAYRAVRNRGTIGGSLCHADPAADWLCTLLALGASVLLWNGAGGRSMELRDFVAGAFATEYSQGTMRNLLVREPRRARLLTGKFLALATFIGVAVVLEIVVSCAVALLLAPGRGITTSAWTSSTGINDLLQATLHVFLASVGYGLVGAAAGVLFRSPGVAIGRSSNC